MKYHELFVKCHQLRIYKVLCTVAGSGKIPDNFSEISQNFLISQKFLNKFPKGFSKVLKVSQMYISQ